MAKIAAEACVIVKEPDVIKQLAIVGVEPQGGGPEEFDRVLKDEIKRVGQVVKTVGIRLD
jgi:tripartite-type tricarboxylate transporter receptor subunit TctC